MASFPKFDDSQSAELESFDRSKASFPVRIVPIQSVIDLLNQTHRPDKVAEFRHAMDEGASFPPISVLRVGKRFVVTDGHKRLTACKQRGAHYVMVELWTVSQWFADLRRQTRHKTRQIVVLGSKSTVDKTSRKAAIRLFWDIVGHWKRIFASLAFLLFGESSDEKSDSGETTQTQAQNDQSYGVFRRLVEECRQFSGHLLLITISLGALGGSQLYLTWLAKLWSEGPLVDGSQSEMSRLLVRAVVTSAIFVLSLFASRYVLRSLNQLLVQSLRDRAQRRVLQVELSSARRFPAGELISRMFNDAGMLTNFIREILRRAIGESMVVIGALSMAFYLNWKLAIVMSVVGPLVALILSSWGRMIRRQSEYAQQELGTLSSALSEQLSGLSTIKGFQTESYETRKFGQQDSLYRAHMLHSEAWMALMMSSVWLVTCAGLIGVVWFGTHEVFAHTTTRGALLAFCLYAVQTIEPLRRLSEVQGLLQRALASASRVFDVIDLPFPEQSGALALSAPVQGEVIFQNVDFGYTRERPVLRNVDLAVKSREMVAFVAASGGGKSTIAKMMLRLVDPEHGRIMLDGIDLRELRLDQLRRAVCVIEQEPFVFSGSLFDNIRYGSFEASRKQVQEAAALAGLTDFIANLPAGLDSILTEAGRNLSGGQKQRIALARGIVRDPSLLVLDEATSALDGETERVVFDGLQSWLARRTVLVMSHRLATVTRFPRVVVLQDGSIAGDASSLELLETCPVFATLFAEQLTPLENTRVRLSS